MQKKRSQGKTSEIQTDLLYHGNGRDRDHALHDCVLFRFCAAAFFHNLKILIKIKGKQNATLLQTFETVFTDPFGKESYFIDSKIGLYIFREGNIFFAGGLFADFAVEMKMPVFVGIFITPVMAKFVFGSRIFLDTVNHPFFFKGF